MGSEGLTAAETLAAAKKRWDDSRAEGEAARIGLEDAVRGAVQSREMSQAAVARMLGWPRQRVNTVVKEEVSP